MILATVCFFLILCNNFDSGFYICNLQLIFCMSIYSQLYCNFLPNVYYGPSQPYVQIVLSILHPIVHDHYNNWYVLVKVHTLWKWYSSLSIVYKSYIECRPCDVESEYQKTFCNHILDCIYSKCDYEPLHWLTI